MELTKDIVKKELLTISPEKFEQKNLELKDIKRIKSGRKNYNYRFTISNKEYILRINQFQDYEHSKTEYLNLKLINTILENNNKYPIQIVLKKKGKFIKSPYIIITYLEGKELILNEKNVSLLAKEVAKFSNIKLNKEYYFLKKANYKDILKRHEDKEKYVSEYSKKLGTLAKTVRKNIEKLKTKDIKNIYKLMHGDLGGGNVLIYKNKIKFIDFEYLKIGDPVLDIVKLSFYNNKYDEFNKYKKQFFKIYIEETKDKDIEKRYEFYRLIQIYSWFIADIKNIIKAKKLDKKLISKDIKLEDITFSYNYLKKNNLIKIELKEILEILDL